MTDKIVKTEKPCNLFDLVARIATALEGIEKKMKPSSDNWIFGYREKDWPCKKCSPSECTCPATLDDECTHSSDCSCEQCDSDAWDSATCADHVDDDAEPAKPDCEYCGDLGLCPTSKPSRKLRHCNCPAGKKLLFAGTRKTDDAEPECFICRDTGWADKNIMTDSPESLVPCTCLKGREVEKVKVEMVACSICGQPTGLRCKSCTK